MLFGALKFNPLKPKTSGSNQTSTQPPSEPVPLSIFLKKKTEEQLKAKIKKDSKEYRAALGKTKK